MGRSSNSSISVFVLIFFFLRLALLFLLLLLPSVPSCFILGLISCVFLSHFLATVSSFLYMHFFSVFMAWYIYTQILGFDCAGRFTVLSHGIWCIHFFFFCYCMHLFSRAITALSLVEANQSCSFTVIS